MEHPDIWYSIYRNEISISDIWYRVSIYRICCWHFEFRDKPLNSLTLVAIVGGQLLLNVHQQDTYPYYWFVILDWRSQFISEDRRRKAPISHVWVVILRGPPHKGEYLSLFGGCGDNWSTRRVGKGVTPTGDRSPDNVSRDWLTLPVTMVTRYQLPW